MKQAVGFQQHTHWGSRHLSHSTVLIEHKLLYLFPYWTVIHLTLTLQIVNSTLTLLSLNCGLGFVNSEWLSNLYWVSEAEIGKEPNPVQLFNLFFCSSRICVVLYCRNMQYCIIMRTAYLSTNFLYYVVQLSGNFFVLYLGFTRWPINFCEGFRHCRFM